MVLNMDRNVERYSNIASQLGKSGADYVRIAAVDGFAIEADVDARRMLTPRPLSGQWRHVGLRRFDCNVVPTSAPTRSPWNQGVDLEQHQGAHARVRIVSRVQVVLYIGGRRRGGRKCIPCYHGCLQEDLERGMRAHSHGREERRLGWDVRCLLQRSCGREMQGRLAPIVRLLYQCSRERSEFESLGLETLEICKICCSQRATSSDRTFGSISIDYRRVIGEL